MLDEIKAISAPLGLGFGLSLAIPRSYMSMLVTVISILMTAMTAIILILCKNYAMTRQVLYLKVKIVITKCSLTQTPNTQTPLQSTQ